MTHCSFTSGSARSTDAAFKPTRSAYNEPIEGIAAIVSRHLSMLHALLLSAQHSRRFSLYFVSRPDLTFHQPLELLGSPFHLYLALWCHATLQIDNESARSVKAV